MKRMSRIYVAGSWKNEDEQQKLVAALRQNGHKVYDFTRPKGVRMDNVWHDVNLDENECDMESYETSLNEANVRERFNSHVNAMMCADTCVLLLPCGRSAHAEAGFMAGMNKRVIVFNPSSKWKPELMYLLFDGEAGDLETLLKKIAEPVPGVCQVCGCTDNNPCLNPKVSDMYCHWVNPEQTLCSFCADEEIANDPETVHCVNDTADIFM